MVKHYSDSLADVICAELVVGKSLNTICKQDDMPHISTIFDWLSKHPYFSEKYARAREQQADYLAEQIIDIADEIEIETVYDGDNVTLELNNTAVQRNRLRIDARKWYAGKLRPKKYGDKTILSGDEENPIVTQSLPPPNIPIDEWLKRYRDVDSAAG